MAQAQGSWLSSTRPLRPELDRTRLTCSRRVASRTSYRESPGEGGRTTHHGHVRVLPPLRDGAAGVSPTRARARCPLLLLGGQPNDGALS